MTLSCYTEALVRSERPLKDLQRITCPVLLEEGTVTTACEKCVVDVLGERLPYARVVELEGDLASRLQRSDPFLVALQLHLSRAPRG